MNGGPRLSASTRALVAAAKADVPSGTARTKMWARVSSAVGGAASAAVATSAAAATSAVAATSAAGTSSGATGTGGALAAGGASAMKMLAIGTLFGGTVTVGVAAMLLQIGPAPSTTPRVATPALAAGMANTGASHVNPPAHVAHVGGEDAPQGALGGAETVALQGQPPGASGAMGDQASEPGVTAVRPAQGSSPGLAAASAPSAHAVHARATKRVEDSNSLSLEASLITQARAALVAGDALAALRKARAARMLPVRQLVPEALAVEAQALRALGRDGEASGIDQALRVQYPESALGR